MQTITTNNQSSFNSETNVQIMSIIPKSNAKSTPVSSIENSKSTIKFGISQFLSNFSESVNSSLILNSIYFMQKRNSEYTTSLL